MAELNMVQALNTALHELFAAEPRVILMGEDVGKNGGVFRVKSIITRSSSACMG